MFKIYIRTFERNFYDDFVYAAWEGFKNKKYDICFYEDIDEVPVSKHNVIISFVEETKYYFSKLGITIPPPLNVPPELQKISNRITYNTTLGNVRIIEADKFPIFIKPIHKTTNFIAGPIKSKSDFDIYMYPFNDDLEVQISDVVNFESEYRCFVNGGKLVGIKHYIGDFTLFPDIYYIRRCISAFESAPIAYTLDVGIVGRINTLLVECNDAWSIGHYGLDSKIYTDLLLTRWIEIVK